MLTAAIKQSAAVRLTTIQVPDLNGDGSEQEADGDVKMKEATYDHVQDVDLSKYPTPQQMEEHFESGMGRSVSSCSMMARRAV